MLFATWQSDIITAAGCCSGVTAMSEQHDEKVGGTEAFRVSYVCVFVIFTSRPIF